MDKENIYSKRTANDYTNTVSSNTEAIVLPKHSENMINRNKPWRIVIRRIVADGGSDYKDLS